MVTEIDIKGKANRSIGETIWWKEIKGNWYGNTFEIKSGIIKRIRIEFVDMKFFRLYYVTKFNEAIAAGRACSTYEEALEWGNEDPHFLTAADFKK